MQAESRLANAAKFWEPFRLVYNFILAAIVVWYWAPELVQARPIDWVVTGVILLVLATIANFLFCAAYPCDLIFQVLMNPSGEPKERLQARPELSPLQIMRWGLSVAGLSLAVSLELWVLLHQGMA